jgi:hypothetical protein
LVSRYWLGSPDDFDGKTTTRRSLRLRCRHEAKGGVRRRFRESGEAGLGLALALCLGFALFFGGADQASAQQAFQVDVPPGERRSLKVRDVPVEARLEVEVRATGPVHVSLVGPLEGAPAQPPAVVFEGSATNHLTFSARVPQRGSYFVVLDNREGKEMRSVALTVRAHAPGAGVPEGAIEGQDSSDVLGGPLVWAGGPAGIRAS